VCAVRGMVTVMLFVVATGCLEAVSFRRLVPCIPFCMPELHKARPPLLPELRACYLYVCAVWGMLLCLCMRGDVVAACDWEGVWELQCLYDRLMVTSLWLFVVVRACGSIG
jgi:hypothetical protein